jgi:predicted SnoaL-like aldol condensation-catalyzing enzyme
MAISRDDAVTAVDAYFKGIIAHDVSEVPLHDNATFKQPNGNVYEGKADVTAFLNALTWTDVRIESYVADGDQVGVLFNYDRANGMIKGFDYFRFEDNQIREIRPFLNPIVPYPST